MKEQKQKAVKALIFQIAMWSVVTSVVWLGISLYQTLTKKPQVEVTKEVLKPLNPSLDMGVVEELKGREKVIVE